ncbi:MAG TPA: hypothetical protein VKB76_14840, partial [Ktedonobacterales bacterium]|nr:hypothetical protein [Ktedonobacterales bacterium]
MNHHPGTVGGKHATGSANNGANVQITPTPALSISVQTPTGHAHTPTPQVTTTTTTTTPPTTVPAPVPSWKAAFQESAPNCNDPGGTSWAHLESGGGNVIACSSSGLVMQQVQSYYPETDLHAISGGYNANIVQVKVHAHFDNVNSSTYAGTDAAIDMQAPLNTSACGGLIFEIRPNGNWRVQQTHSDCTMPVITNGWVGAAADYDMMVRVQNGQFIGFINGAQVVSLGDSISGQVVGLMVIDWAWPTAKITYSRFEVDQWR